jgi:hypothetical protein
VESLRDDFLNFAFYILIFEFYGFALQPMLARYTYGGLGFCPALTWSPAGAAPVAAVKSAPVVRTLLPGRGFVYLSTINEFPFFIKQKIGRAGGGHSLKGPFSVVSSFVVLRRMKLLLRRMKQPNCLPHGRALPAVRDFGRAGFG